MQYLYLIESPFAESKKYISLLGIGSQVWYTLHLAFIVTLTFHLPHEVLAFLHLSHHLRLQT